ncbi:hypothetical protein [Labedaea rhizosphaerae]|uniref:Ig-like domain-containing protein n=1 Tax=Labedaea rhizosphaerae TaxID=598644 RepID=A0A4V3D0A6_LABRH|nr:hypothetical protein [Labedaea rhizosphaerae]TDQ05015.1 hypothetical protein EV186_101979 [Labedaea rhizosphaerae]
MTSTTYPGEYGGATGVEGTFVFSSPVPGAASYTYHFNDDDPVTVPAGADGTASVRYTPPHRDTNYLTVQTTFTDGTTSEELFWSFMVNGNGPQVECTPSEVPAGGEFTCTLAPVQVGAQSYLYQWGDGPEQALPMGSDRTATITLTMPADVDYAQTLSTWSVDGSGARSDVDYTSIYRTGFAASPRGTRMT